jgi:hypothetical protein
MRGWTPDGTEVELTGWQAAAVKTLLDPQWHQVTLIRGRQWGWSTVLETARRYDLNHALKRQAMPGLPEPAVLEPP